jgi:methylglutaconyl-CoA hydratase
MSELVLYELRSPAAVLTINRADKRNALSQALIAELTHAFDRAGDDPAARCIILTGAGTTFCAGMDLAELRESVNRNAGADEVWQDAMKLATLYDRIYTSPKPTIVAVNGTAVAGGAGLVTVCDLAVSVSTSQFGYPEVRRGLVAAMVMPHLLRHVGERLARHLLLSGELIGAEEAVRGGLINEIASPNHLLPRALELAKSLAEGGPQALAATKSLLQQFSRQAVSIEEAARASAAPRLTEECRQGLRAFFEKKSPPWSV